MLKYVIATLAVFAAASSSFAAGGGEPAKDPGKKEGHEASKDHGKGHEAGKDHGKKDGEGHKKEGEAGKDLAGGKGK